jgi:L,D-peptidoglycan transpeptidase YkuD (ErfK/YbiS/YcfS/YnhG family)
MRTLCVVYRIMLCLGLLAVQGCVATTPKAFQRLNPSIRQTILVSPTQKSSDQALLSAWQKQGTKWQRVFFVSAVIGRNGLAPDGQKKGDGRTPSGIYPLGPAFGYGPSIDTGLAYRQATDIDFWVDDVHSMQYNQWVHGKPAADSFERMHRSDNLYQYGIIIGYNMHPIRRGAGSAIFMHIWRRYNGPTSGCVALNQRNLRKVLHWLNRDYQPVIILELNHA